MFQQAYPGKLPLVKKILNLIASNYPRGFTKMRTVCVVERFSVCIGYKLADDVQERNINDMVASALPLCLQLSGLPGEPVGEVAKKGLKPFTLLICARWPLVKRKGRCGEMNDILKVSSRSSRAGGPIPLKSFVLLA